MPLFGPFWPPGDPPPGGGPPPLQGPPGPPQRPTPDPPPQGGVPPPILGHFGPFLAIFGLFWPILAIFGPFWPILTHFGLKRPPRGGVSSNGGYSVTKSHLNHEGARRIFGSFLIGARRQNFPRILMASKGVSASYTPPRGGVIPRLVPQKSDATRKKRILNVNPVQTIYRTEVVQILGRNLAKKPIKWPFLGPSAAI